MSRNLLDTSMDDDFHEHEEQEQKKIKVIIPPPDIKTVIDKTASYVAKNGANFEALILKTEQNNAKFNFLRFPDDPYRPYYQQKINEILGIKPDNEKEQKQASLNGAAVATNGAIDETTLNGLPQQDGQQLDQDVQQQSLEGVSLTTQPVSAVQAAPLVQKENEYQRQLRLQIFGDIEERKQNNEIKPPPTDNFSISHPILANIDHDVIKLTAQFVARNGQKFLQGLTEREARNPQFDFLKPTHGLFSYFTQLVESYSKVLIPRNEQLQRLQKFAQKDGGRMEILKAAADRYLWDKMQEEDQKLRADQHDNGFRDNDEQMQVDTIDWHDFVVVEKIDLYDDEEMNAQEDAEKEELKEQEKIKEQIRKQIEENQQIMSMPPPGAVAPDGMKPMQTIDTQKLPPAPQTGGAPNEIVVSTALDQDMKIKKNYQRTTAKDEGSSVAQGTQKCPKCQQEIPISEWKEHMKLELMDPKWREEKLKREERAKLNSMASGDEITQNLRRFAQERRDLYPNVAGPVNQNTGGGIGSQGSNEQQTNIIQQQPTSQQQQQTLSQQQQQQQRIIWDGQASSITRTTANIAMLQHQQQRNLQEALQTRGQLDPKSMEKLNKATNPVPTVKNIQSAILSKEQMIKQGTQQQKQSNIQDDEDEALAFLQPQLRSEAEWLRLFPGKINVQIRVSANNQVMPMTVDSRVTIGQLKDQLSQLVGGGYSRDQLRLNGQKNLPMKDNLTLAFYNIPDGAILELATKTQKK